MARHSATAMAMAATAAKGGAFARLVTLATATTLLAACGGSVSTSEPADGAPPVDSTLDGDTSDTSVTDAADATDATDAADTATPPDAPEDVGHDADATPACSSATCGAPFVCCGDACVYPQNDIFNCGACGTKCGGASPYCDHGTCGAPPCTSPSLCGASGTCCGGACCNAGEICCDVPGPISSGPKCQAPDPATHSCSKGCPLCVCASPDTPIATPTGDRPISSLREGDLVYSVDADAVVVVPIGRVRRAAVHDHHVVRVTLASGAVLRISAPHPTADGRTFGDLHAGDRLDGIAITRVEWVPYEHAFTYDVLPVSSTGTYFAAGARIGSTLPR